MIFKKGQTLVELLVVMTVVVLIIVGLMTVSRQSIRTEDAARAQSEGTKLAEEGIEQMWGVKNDQKFVYLDALPTNSCLVPVYSSLDKKWSTTPCTANNGNNTINLSGSNVTFTRKIGVKNPTGNGIETVCVDSVVFWQDQSGTHQAVSQTLMGNGNPNNPNQSSVGCATISFTYP